MATVEELEQQVLGLKRQIELMEQRFSFHLGYDESQATIHNPHPNMSTSERAGLPNNITMTGNLSVSGSTTLSGNTILSGGTTIDGPSTLEDNLNITTGGSITNDRGDTWDDDSARFVSNAADNDAIDFAWDNGTTITNQGAVTMDGTTVQFGTRGKSADATLRLSDGTVDLGFGEIGEAQPLGGRLLVNFSGVHVTRGGSGQSGSGTGVLSIQQAWTDPTTNPSGAVILYVDSSGNLLARTSAGNVRTVAAV